MLTPGKQVREHYARYIRQSHRREIKQDFVQGPLDSVEVLLKMRQHLKKKKKKSFKAIKQTWGFVLANVYFSFPNTAQMSMLLYRVKPCLKLSGRQKYLEVPSRPVRAPADLTQTQEKGLGVASGLPKQQALSYFSQASPVHFSHFIFTFLRFLTFTTFPYLLCILRRF